jgi:hypothetical protein
MHKPKNLIRRAKKKCPASGDRWNCGDFQKTKATEKLWLLIVGQ